MNKSYCENMGYVPVKRTDFSKSRCTIIVIKSIVELSAVLKLYYHLEDKKNAYLKFT